MSKHDLTKEFWYGRAFSFFQNKQCEYFPCHSTDHPEDFNCLFCYCPLYSLGKDCGGSFTYLDNGYKDCSRCLFPHERNNYGEITGRFQEIVQAMQQKKEADSA